MGDRPTKLDIFFDIRTLNIFFDFFYIEVFNSVTFWPTIFGAMQLQSTLRI